MNIVEKKRNAGLDYLKFIGIFFVVVAHFLPNASILRIGIYSFHIPIFFFIAGYNYNPNRNFIINLKKNLKRVIIPYVLYYTISLSIEIILANGNIYQFLEIFYLNGKLSIWNSVLWFFPCYFSVSILFSLFYKLIKKYTYICMSIIMLCSILFFYNNHLYIFGINKIILLFLYFLIGFIIKNKNYNVKKRNLFFISFVIMIGLFVFLNLNNTLSINLNDINNPIIYLIFSIFECLCLYFITIKAPRNKLIEIISKNSVFIMCTHLFFRIVLVKILCTQSLIYCLSGIIVFVIEVVIILLLRKIRNEKIKFLLQYFGLNFN